MTESKNEIKVPAKMAAVRVHKVRNSLVTLPLSRLPGLRTFLAAGRGRLIQRASRQYGGPEALQHDEVDVPKVGANEVLVQIAYSGINFIDTYLRTGLCTLSRMARAPF